MESGGEDSGGVNRKGEGVEGERGGVERCIEEKGDDEEWRWREERKERGEEDGLTGVTP